MSPLPLSFSTSIEGWATVIGGSGGIRNENQFVSAPTFEDDRILCQLEQLLFCEITETGSLLETRSHCEIITVS